MLPTLPNVLTVAWERLKTKCGFLCKEELLNRGTKNGCTSSFDVNGDPSEDLQSFIENGCDRDKKLYPDLFSCDWDSICESYEGHQKTQTKKEFCDDCITILVL
jgi:hypothetical protein